MPVISRRTAVAFPASGRGAASRWIWTCFDSMIGANVSSLWSIKGAGATACGGVPPEAVTASVAGFAARAAGAETAGTAGLTGISPSANGWIFACAGSGAIRSVSSDTGTGPAALAPSFRIGTGCSFGSVSAKGTAVRAELTLSLALSEGSTGGSAAAVRSSPSGS